MHVRLQECPTRRAAKRVPTMGFSEWGARDGRVNYRTAQGPIWEARITESTFVRLTRGNKFRCTGDEFGSEDIQKGSDSEKAVDAAEADCEIRQTKTNSMWLTERLPLRGVQPKRIRRAA